jgi:hypothetical protein
MSPGRRGDDGISMSAYTEAMARMFVIAPEERVP